MQSRFPILPYTLYAIGAILLTLGLGAWWQQNGVVYTLPNPNERVALAVVATNPARALTATARAAITPSTTPSPTSTATATPAQTTTPDTTSTARATVTASNTPTPSTTPTPDPFPAAAEPPNRIVIPKIGLDAPIVFMEWQTSSDWQGSTFTEWVVPDNDVGWHINSAVPGNDNNVVLSGHHNVGAEVFRYLVDLEPGDVALLYAAGHEYQYVVEEKYILHEEGQPLEVRQANNSYLLETEDERLTIVTCWPYETNSHRVVIIARPVLPTP